MTERNEAFDEFLDEVYPEVEVAGLTFLPSSILFNCDPIAYRIFCSDWEDSETEE